MKKLIIIFLLFTCFCSHAQFWKPYGLGFDSNSTVFDLVSYNGNLYGCCVNYSGITLLNGIGMWDGTNWNPLDNGTNVGCPFTMTQYNGDLIAGGQFNNINGNQNARSIAKWDGSNWYAMGHGVVSGTVQTMIEYNGSLYIGGNFDNVDSMPNVRDIARWDGTDWYPVCTLSSGLTMLFSMAVFNNELYIGGYFGSINGTPYSNIAKFDGTNWTDVGGGLNGDVFALVTDTINNRLYAGGNFNYAGGGTLPCPSNVAYWDGTSWNAIGINGPDLYPTSMAVYKSELYIGNCAFSQVKVNQSGDTLNFIARWDGNDWQPLGKGLDGCVQAMCVYNNELAVGGGGFIHAGDSVVNQIASWTDTTTSIKEISSPAYSLKISPNPTNEKVTVQSPLKIISWQLISEKGEIIKKEKLKTAANQFEISVAAFQRGFYILKASSAEGKMVTGKLVKN